MISVQIYIEYFGIGNGLATGITLTLSKSVFFSNKQPKPPFPIYFNMEKKSKNINSGKVNKAQELKILNYNLDHRSAHLL